MLTANEEKCYASISRDSTTFDFAEELPMEQQHSLSLQLLIRFFTGMINDQEKGTLE